MTATWLRWTPAVAVPAVIAAGVLAGSLPASARDPLPEKTPTQVLAMIGQHQTKSFSGTVEQSSELGLPDLPQVGPTSGAATGSLAELLTGPHSARVYVDGPTKARIQVMDRMAEHDAVRQGNELWLYNSKDNTATHVTLPARASKESRSHDMPAGVATPEELAAKMLEKVDSSTEVTVADDTEVAGRAAYSLVLTPRSDVTLVGSVAVAVDGENGMPLSVEVRARGQQEPAFRTAFSSLTLGAPDAGLFNFSPPPGASVKELAVPSHKTGTNPAGKGMANRNRMHKDLADKDLREHGPTVSGTGWERIVGIPAPSASAPSASRDSGKQSVDKLLNDPLLRQATVTVQGGRAISTSLVNVLLTDDGRTFVGAVPLERLQAAAAAT
ncbi:outer membrane lipoprotein carrier protein LolA [Arthrobacter sp. NPDC056727]|uniref:LolA family protein n=1 Tax=Arthrobacter sp. NPDC056727 TaxID=3345927 RepID=UPI00366B2187